MWVVGVERVCGLLHQEMAEVEIGYEVKRFVTTCIPRKPDPLSACCNPPPPPALRTPLPRYPRNVRMNTDFDLLVSLCASQRQDNSTTPASDDEDAPPGPLGEDFQRLRGRSSSEGGLACLSSPLKRKARSTASSSSTPGLTAVGSASYCRQQFVAMQLEESAYDKGGDASAGGAGDRSPSSGEGAASSDGNALALASAIWVGDHGAANGKGRGSSRSSRNGSSSRSSSGRAGGVAHHRKKRGGQHATMGGAWSIGGPSAQGTGWNQHGDGTRSAPSNYYVKSESHGVGGSGQRPRRALIASPSSLLLASLSSTSPSSCSSSASSSSSSSSSLSLLASSRLGAEGGAGGSSSGVVGVSDVSGVSGGATGVGGAVEGVVARIGCVSSGVSGGGSVGGSGGGSGGGGGSIVGGGGERTILGADGAAADGAGGVGDIAGAEGLGGPPEGEQKKKRRLTQNRHNASRRRQKKRVSALLTSREGVVGRGVAALFYLPPTRATGIAWS